MPAGKDMGKETFRTGQARPLGLDRAHLLRDHGVPARLVTVQDQTDVRQGHTHTLTGLQDAEPVQMLLAVVAVAGTGAVRYHHAGVLPVPEHMCGHTEAPRGLPDPHTHQYDS